VETTRSTFFEITAEGGCATFINIDGIVTLNQAGNEKYLSDAKGSFAEKPVLSAVVSNSLD
jgi:hypothetical protein